MNKNPQGNGLANSTSGMVLLVVLSFMVIIMIICGALFTMTRNHLVSMRALWASDRALLAAQSALELAKADIDATFRAFYNSPYFGGTDFRWRRLDWFDSPGSGSIGRDGYVYAYPQGGGGGTQIWVNVVDTRFVNLLSRELILTARARVGDAERSVTEVVQYGLAQSRVFDYAYFINNFGWFWGTPIYANGDVRANGNFSLRSGPTINGDVYAGVNPALGAPGNVEGSWLFQTLLQYYGGAPRRGRPGNPPHAGYSEDWAMGYPGVSVAHALQDILEMPYLGDLREYEYLAQYDNGTISQGGHVIISNVYRGLGPDNTPGTGDDGTIMLSGTRANPLILDGPVVVQGDVIIKGYVSGQGTIYAGRNVHVADDIYYLDPPRWEKPDADPGRTAELNATRDFLGLAAKGNVIIGNYTVQNWRDNVTYYLQPSTFTKPYDTDASDASIGYDSDRNPNNGYRFNGDYTALDGGAKLGNAGNTVTNRRYYESSVSHTNFNQFAGGNNSTVSNIDAVVYNNHAITGYTPQGLTINGALVGRDEGIVFGGNIRMNWDIRLGSESAEAIPTDFYLPRTLATPVTRNWKEGG